MENRLGGVLIRAATAYVKDIAIDYLKGHNATSERVLIDIIRSLSTAHRYLVRAAKVPDVRRTYVDLALSELNNAEMYASSYVMAPERPKIVSNDLIRTIRDMSRRLSASVLSVSDIAGVEREIFGLTDTILALME